MCVAFKSWFHLLRTYQSKTGYVLAYCTNSIGDTWRVYAPLLFCRKTFQPQCISTCRFLGGFEFMVFGVCVSHSSHSNTCDLPVHYSLILIDCRAPSPFVRGVSTEMYVKSTSLYWYVTAMCFVRGFMCLDVLLCVLVHWSFGMISEILESSAAI